MILSSRGEERSKKGRIVTFTIAKYSISNNKIIRRTINTEPLTKREYSQAFYMMLKARLESLSNEYQEFIEIVDN